MGGVRLPLTWVAFVVDVFAQRIVGWHAATDKRTDLVLTPLRIALWDRGRQGLPRPGALNTGVVEPTGVGHER